MSLKGPSLRRHRDGRAYVKLNGKFITLGKWTDKTSKTIGSLELRTESL